jgi:hypothetical protein
LKLSTIALMNHFVSWLGGLVNALGVPGLVQDTEYRSHTSLCQVRVRRERIFTVVTVNGVDVYFHRFSGRIDGCGTRPTNG